jgi:VanZ family protein
METTSREGATPALLTWRWLVTLAYFLALVLGTHLPEGSLAVKTAVGSVGGDKWAHFVGYFGLSLLIFGLCRAGRRAWTAAGLVAGLAALGAADEVSQPYFHRSAEWADWFADLAGVMLGYLLGRFLLDPCLARLAGESQTAGSAVAETAMAQPGRYGSYVSGTKAE